MIEIIGDETLKKFQHNAKRILAYVKKIKTDNHFIHLAGKKNISNILTSSSNLEEAMLSFDFDSMMSCYFVLKHAIQQTFSNHDHHWNDNDTLYPAWLFEPDNFDHRDSIFALIEVKNYSQLPCEKLSKA